MSKGGQRIWIEYLGGQGGHRVLMQCLWTQGGYRVCLDRVVKEDTEFVLIESLGARGQGGHRILMESLGNQGEKTQT